MTILIWAFSAHPATNAAGAAVPRSTSGRWILTGLLAGGFGGALGWCGLTVLATLTICGPTLLGVRPDAGDTTRSASGGRSQPSAWASPPSGSCSRAWPARSSGEGAGPAMLMTVGGLAAYTDGIVTVAWPLLRATGLAVCLDWTLIGVVAISHLGLLIRPRAPS